MKFATDYYKLENGVRVLLVSMSHVDSVTTLVLVKTGSRNEEVQEAGISHILEHMVFKGTKKYPGALILAEEVDALGAINNAFTGKEYTGYYITSAYRHAVKSLEIIGEMLMHPLLPQTELVKEREVIVEEINMYEDLPMERASEEFENLLYGGSRMGRLIIGTKETVRSTTDSDLRKYREKWYRGGNILVVVAGRVGSEESVRSKIEEMFGQAAEGKVEGFVDQAGYGSERTFHIKRATEQAHFMVGVPGLTTLDPRRYALSLAQIVLGGNMSSRLFNEIREKRGWAYYVRAEMDNNWDVGSFAVKAGVKLDKVGEAVALVKSEMLRLSESITEGEIARAKEYILGKLPLSLEGTMEVAQYLGMRALSTDEIRQPEEAIAAIRAVTRSEAAEILGELVQSGEMRTVVLGPKSG